MYLPVPLLQERRDLRMVDKLDLDAVIAKWSFVILLFFQEPYILFPRAFVLYMPVCASPMVADCGQQLNVHYLKQRA
jgi:hypothetical protein